MNQHKTVSELETKVRSLEAQLEAATIWERARAEQLRTMQDEIDNLRSAIVELAEGDLLVSPSELWTLLADQ